MVDPVTVAIEGLRATVIMAAGIVGAWLAVVAGLVLHEFAHFAAGYAMGTVREVGLGWDETPPGPRRWLFFGAYVRQSTDDNWISWAAPLAWGLPLWPLHQASLVNAAWLIVAFPVFVAFFTWFLSDLPARLGMIDVQSIDRMPVFAVDENGRIRLCIGEEFPVGDDEIAQRIRREWDV